MRTWTTTITHQGRDLRATFAWVDHGNGPTTYFGAPGDDSRMGAELLSVENGDGVQVDLAELPISVFEADAEPPWMNQREDQ